MNKQYFYISFRKGMFLSSKGNKWEELFFLILTLHKK